MNSNQELIIVGPRVYKILEICQILSQTAVTQGLEVKTAEFTNEPLMTNEVAYIRMGKEIYSPLPLESKVNILVCFEPIMAVKIAIKYLSDEGIIIMNTHSILPIKPFYYQVISLFEQLVEKVIKLDTFQIAKEAGDIHRANFVMLGALSALNNMPTSLENMIKVIEKIVDSRNLKICLKAIELGSKTVSFSKL